MAGSGSSGCSISGPAIYATLRTCMTSLPAGDSRPRALGCPPRQDFLVHVTRLSVIFRAQFRDQPQKTDLCLLVDEHVWNKD